MKEIQGPVGNKCILQTDILSLFTEKIYGSTRGNCQKNLIILIDSIPFIHLLLNQFSLHASFVPIFFLKIDLFYFPNESIFLLFVRA